MALSIKKKELRALRPGETLVLPQPDQKRRKAIEAAASKMKLLVATSGGLMRIWRESPEKPTQKPRQRP